MDKEELKELDYKSVNILKNIAKNYKKNKVDILDFYPKFDLKGPYTNFNPQSKNNLKPFQLLPFFNNVIVDIKPFKNEETFNKYYGMSTNELLELYDKGVVHFNLFSPFVDFHNLENDYLDCILDKTSANSCWSNFYYGYVVNNGFKASEDISLFFKDKTFDFGNNLLNDMGLVDPLSIVAMDIINGIGEPMISIPDEIYKNATEKSFIKLWTCGFNDINDFLKRFLEEGNGRLDWAFVFSNIYNNFICNPILDSLNGTYLVNNRFKELSKDLHMREFNQIFPKINKSTPKFEIDESLILNENVGKVLCDNISIPTLMSFEDYDDYDCKTPIKALKSLEDAVDKKNVVEIMDLTEELKNELYLAGNIAKDMQSSIKHKLDLMDKFSLGIGLIGSLGMQIKSPDVYPIFQLMSIVGSAGSLASKSKALNLIFNKFSRCSKQDHILFLYDNYEEFNVSEFNKVPQIKSNVQFNDKLTNKYEYYEYLYNNLPIIRVLIDIYTEQIFGNGWSIKSDNIESKQFVESWINKEFPIYKMKLSIKHSLLYGVSYLLKQHVYRSNSKNIKVNLINPKFIRPVYKNGNIEGYKMLDNNYEDKYFSVDSVSYINQISLIEKYIFLLDLIYPKITNKGARPQLIYDKLESNKVELEQNINNYDNSVDILQNSLELINKLDNNIYFESGMLMSLGLIHKKNKDYKKALNYFEDAQKLLSNTYSDALMKRDFDLTNFIIDTQKFL